MKLAVAPGDQLAYVRADWGYEASLFTAPDFPAACNSKRKIPTMQADAHRPHPGTPPPSP